MVKILVRNLKTVVSLYALIGVAWYFIFGFSQIAFRALTLGAVGLFVWYVLFDVTLINYSKTKKKYWE